MAAIRDLVDNEEDVNILDDLDVIAPIRRPRRIYVRRNHFECWDDTEFITRFRLRKATVEMLYEKLHNNLKSPTDRNSALSPMCKLLLALRYYALGSGERAEIYRNRKGWFSLNIQTICSANLKISDIVARWPGSTHDSTIFSQSYIRNLFETGRIKNAVLLDDSGYRVTPYLLTPLTAPVAPQEILYNEAHIRTRNTVERSYGVWKRRFAILSQCLHLHPENVQDIVVATAVLHNVAIDANEPEPPEIPGIVVRDAVNIYVEANPGGRNDGTRRAIIEGYFSRLLDEQALYKRGRRYLRMSGNFQI